MRSIERNGPGAAGTRSCGRGPRARRLLRLALVALIGSSTGCDLTWTDAGPAQPAGAIAADSGAEPSGVALRFAGDESALYVVSLDAGVFKSPDGGKSWAQLQGSPPRAYCIAVDPKDHDHVAVGERDGDCKDAGDNRSGVWETVNGGQSFGWYLNPATHGCPSQAITALAFSNTKSTLVAATTGGVAVKQQGQAWTLPATPLGKTAVTSVVASETKLWARDAAGELVVSSDEGASWSLATKKALPPGTAFLDGGDAFSLAAFDGFAFMSTKGEDNGKGNNFNQLLILDVANDRWIVEKRVYDAAENPTNDPANGSLNGTGGSAADGHRFVRALVVQGKSGLDRQLYFGVGQDLFKSTGQDQQSGLFSFERIASTEDYGAPPVLDNLYRNYVHADIWDIHVSPSGKTAWLGGDGGVFANDLGAGLGWLKSNTGFHSQHIHMVVGTPAACAYATSDNDAWWNTDPQTWRHDDVGDSNWAMMDVGNALRGNAFALLVRDTSLSTLVGFGKNVPTKDITPGPWVSGCSIPWGSGPNMSQTLNFIQTLPNEPTPASPLDAVLLTTLPLEYTVNGVKHVAIGGQGPVILRNQVFAEHPDVNEGHGSGWAIMASPLPQGAQGFVVTGGHAKPVLFVLTQEQSGSLGLYRGDGALPTHWTQLYPGTLIGGSWNGPVFPNPYDPKVLYVLTTQGVCRSTDGGSSFPAEPGLTAAVTDSDKYPLEAFNGGSWNAVEVGSHATAMGTLSAVSFDPLDPKNRIAAASPFTGVWYSSNGGASWSTLRAALPLPLGPVSSLSLIGDDLLIATEGRGLIKLSGLLKAYP